MRTANKQKLQNTLFDILIIGGGINGAVSAAALSAKGYKVAIIDKKDFASFTSQESSYLAWGGIKYLENYEFSLVRNLCVSRNKLIRNYPSLVKEIRFFCPHQKGFKHSLLKLYLGSWFYWMMGNGFTQPPRFLSRKKIKQEEPIVNLQNVDGGFEYSDSYLVDLDARFVFTFIQKAISFGAVALNYLEAKNISKNQNGLWNIAFIDNLTHDTGTISAKVIINAAGPFVDQINNTNQITTKTHHLLSKGIHLIVPKLTQAKKVLTFIADDNRMFFIIPLGPVSCVGTTDTRVENPYSQVSAEDRDFVLRQINTRLQLKNPLTTEDIIAERCGVRPLAIELKDNQSKDFLSLSRKHVLEIKEQEKLISIFGGKLTDCLNIGDEVSAIVKKMGLSATKNKIRWYGEASAKIKDEFLNKAKNMQLDDASQHKGSEKTSLRLWRKYGEGAFEVLHNIAKEPKMGEIFNLGIELLRAEVHYAKKYEMIETLEDFLRRRTFISLVVPHEQLKNSPAIHEICQILFEDNAEREYKNYFDQHTATY